MTVAAQSLMVSYETLRQQKYTLEKMEELYKTQYELGTVKEQAGTAAAAEVLSFKNQCWQLRHLWLRWKPIWKVYITVCV